MALAQWCQVGNNRQCFRASRPDRVHRRAFGGGWQNWSWATVNFSNTQPVQAGSDSIAVNAGAYQALYLHQTAFDSTLYNNLVFWINGGSSAGHLLQVQATLNGTAQTVVTLPLVTAGTYKISSVAPTASQAIRMVVTVARKTISGASKGFLVTATSVASIAKQDTVEGLVTVN
jgi:hypothetical protein